MVNDHFFDFSSEEMLSRRFAGKLLLRKEIPLSDHHFKQLLLRDQFKSMPAIVKHKFSYTCQRCHNRKLSLFANIPCYRCQMTHLYCRKCIHMGRIMSCEPLYYWTGKEPSWTCFDDPCTWQGTLTKDQQKAADQLIKAIKDQKRELLIWAVTGAGKTEMLFPGISEALKNGKRICLATPRVDVVYELLPRLQQAFSHVYIQGLYAGSDDQDASAQFLVATTHQLLRFKNAFDVLIIDEMDAFPYHADPSLPFAAKRARKNVSTTIYLTATPRKAQRIRVKKNELACQFVPRRFHGFPLPVPQFKMSFHLQKYLRTYKLPPTFFQWFKQRQKRQLLIFVPTRSLADHLAKNLQPFFQKHKTFATSVHADDPDREEKITSFRKHKFTILVTTTILERGVTFPSVDVVVIDAGHDVFDTAALVQIAGRAGRSPNDPTGEVIFIHDGKTKAMKWAVHFISMMNKRGGFK